MTQIKRIFECIAAETIFVVHLIGMLIALFGWLIASIWYVYITVLVVTFISDLYFDYCLLSKWEFALRRLLNPRTNYDYTFSSYYTYKLSQGTLHLSNEFIHTVGLIFLGSSLAINLGFRLWG